MAPLPTRGGAHRGVPQHRDSTGEEPGGSRGGHSPVFGHPRLGAVGHRLVVEVAVRAVVALDRVPQVEPDLGLVVLGLC